MKFYRFYFRVFSYLTASINLSAPPSSKSLIYRWTNLGLIDVPRESVPEPSLFDPVNSRLFAWGPVSYLKTFFALFCNLSMG